MNYSSRPTNPDKRAVSRSSSPVVFDFSHLPRDTAAPGKRRSSPASEAASASAAAAVLSQAGQAGSISGTSNSRSSDLDRIQEMARDAHIVMLRVTPRNFLGLTKGRQSITPLRIDNYLFIFAPHDEPEESLVPLIQDLRRGGAGVQNAVDASEASRNTAAAIVMTSASA